MLRLSFAGRPRNIFVKMVQQPHSLSLKLLLVAEHASTKFGGEAQIAFQYFKRLREMDVDVHLLVHERTRKELDAAFPLDRERMHFVPDSFINIVCFRLSKLLPDRLAAFTIQAVSHLTTEFRQARRARALIREHRFNIVHEVMPVSPKQPSVLFGLGSPVIIGPMNGGIDYPKNYNTAGIVERMVIIGLRKTANLWNLLLPGKCLAALLLVANKRTLDALPPYLKRGKIVEFVENGVDANLFKPRLRDPQNGAFRIVYVGRLVDWKRVDLLVDACRRLKGKLDFRLELVGNGPLRAALEERARNGALADQVIFHGQMQHAEAADVLSRADVMVLPSMREAGGAVVLEAMASGIPVVATQWGGPADYLDSESGILIPPATPEVFITRLSDALLSLAKDADARLRMGQAGRRRVEALYDWRVKMGKLLEIYENVLNDAVLKSKGAAAESRAAEPA